MKGWWTTRGGQRAQIIYDNVENGKYYSGYIYLCCCDKPIRIFTLWSAIGLGLHCDNSDYDLMSRKHEFVNWEEETINY